MRVCLWDLSEGRAEVSESLWTGSVGFCQCSTLETGQGAWLLACPGEQTEEVRAHAYTRMCSVKGVLRGDPLFRTLEVDGSNPHLVE